MNICEEVMPANSWAGERTVAWVEEDEESFFLETSVTFSFL
jgi:hypothetical protein